MERSASRRIRTITALAILTGAVGGCSIDTDLMTTPDNVMVGEPVNFKVKATNRLTCPVGVVIGFLVPFVPKDHLIDQIENDELREHLSSVVDAFCSGEDVDIGDGDVICQIVDGDIVCEFDLATVPEAEAVAMAAAESGGDITCQSSGGRVTCRVPEALVQMGEQAAAATEEGTLLPFECEQVDGIVVCGTLALGPGEMKMDEITLTPEQGGVLRNWIFMFATRQGGVCQSGLLPNIPCSIDAQCGGISPNCGSGICNGGRNGFGCDSDADCSTSGVCFQNVCITGNVGTQCMTSGDCAATGTCEQCDLPDDDQVLPGLACTTTVVTDTARAPAMSPWGLAFLFLALSGVAAVTLQRARGKRRA